MDSLTHMIFPPSKRDMIFFSFAEHSYLSSASRRWSAAGDCTVLGKRLGCRLALVSALGRRRERGGPLDGTGYQTMQPSEFEVAEVVS